MDAICAPCFGGVKCVQVTFSLSLSEKGHPRATAVKLVGQAGTQLITPSIQMLEICILLCLLAF